MPTSKIQKMYTEEVETPDIAGEGKVNALDNTNTISHAEWSVKAKYRLD